MKLIAMIIVVLTMTSCSKYDPNDILDPTSTIEFVNNGFNIDSVNFYKLQQ